MAGAQGTPSRADVADNVRTDDVLSRVISVQLDRVNLETAIKTIASRANVRVQYQARQLDAVTEPVSVSADHLALGVVFERVLRGTGLRALPLTRDVIDIKRADMVASVASEGIVVGTVIDAKTKRPIANATISLDGKSAARTSSDGVFRVTGVANGTHLIAARYIGYSSSSRSVQVENGKAFPVTFALEVSTTTLTEVVTTATGDRRRLEVGNAVGTIKADSVVATNLIRNVSDLLQARVPGVIVQNTDGAVGSPSRIRLRGVSSLALNNDPIVILDGVRLNAQTTVAYNQTDVGSQQMLRRTNNRGSPSTALAPSRLDDIDPNTIESIDVLRGPSASSLYGTDAANGVIVIKTKKGQAGSWRSTFVADDGRSYYPGDAPELWWGFWQVQSGNSVGTDCLLATGTFNVANGTCTQDSVRQFNPQNDPNMKTLGTGTTRSFSGSISGGTTQLQQFLSMRVSDQVGMAQMSAAEARNIERLWSSPAPSWMKRPNTEQDVDGSSRTTFQITPTADISLTANGIYRYVLNGGSGVMPVGVFSGASPADTLGFLPSESQKTKLTSTAKRGMGSSVGNYRPFNWLSLTGTVGGDYTLRSDGSDIRAQDCTAILAAATGRNPTDDCPSGRSVLNDETFVTTVNGGANLSFSPTSWIELRTAIGEQYSHTNFHTMMVGNSDPYNCPLAFGTTLLTPGPVCTSSGWQQFQVAEDQDEAATAGWYVEQTIGMFGLYTTFGRRVDVASAFGGKVNKSPPNYPKFNFSYPLSEQSFFPKQPYVSSLRLRLAYGQSGNQASQTAVRNGFNGAQVVYGNSSSVTNLITLNRLGNVNLRPERGAEWEGGFDVSFLENERLHFEATMSRKLTRDAIVPIEQALSYGVDNVSQYINLGNVENRSLELLARIRILDTRPYSWDFTMTRTQTSNKLVHAAAGGQFGGFTDNNNFTEGYPLYGLWGVPVLSYTDRNGDGILAQDEIAFGPKKFMGAPYPKAEMVYTNDLSLLNGTFHVSASLQQINGLSNKYLINNNNFPRAAIDRTASLASQAAWIQASLGQSYIGETSSLRFNELSVTYTVPQSLVTRLIRAHSLAVTFAGRNLGLWTTYAGKDPNVDTSMQLGDATYDDGTGLPQPRNFTLRFNLGL